MHRTVSFSDVAANLSDLAGGVERDHDRVLVTRDGQVSFVLISPDDLESLEATVAVLSDGRLAASVRQSRAEAARGLARPLRDHT